MPPPTLPPVIAQRQLYRYLLRVKVFPSMESLDGLVKNYYVEAPTQCSALKHTAFRAEVDEIMHVRLGTPEDDERFTLTFSTDEDCVDP